MFFDADNRETAPFNHDFNLGTPGRTTGLNRNTSDQNRFGRQSNYEERLSSANTFKFQERWDMGREKDAPLGSSYQPKQVQKNTAIGRISSYSHYGHNTPAKVLTSPMPRQTRSNYKVDGNLKISEITNKLLNLCVFLIQCLFGLYYYQFCKLKLTKR